MCSSTDVAPLHGGIGVVGDSAGERCRQSEGPEEQSFFFFFLPTTWIQIFSSSVPEPSSETIAADDQGLRTRMARRQGSDPAAPEFQHT